MASDPVAIRDVLRPSPATGQSGPSLTLQKETKTCEGCGQEYEAYVLYGNIQQRGLYQTRCRTCARAEADRLQQEERLTELKNTAESQRDFWEETYGVPTLFWRKDFAGFDRRLQPKAFDVLSGYNHNFDEGNEKAAPSLVLLSPNAYGVGKTHLVCALANRIVKTEETAVMGGRGLIRTLPCPVYFATEARLLSRIRATYNIQGGETDEDIYQALQGYKLLIIDDVGKVRPRDSSFLQSVYYRVIDDRYTNEGPLILTTNLDYAELEAHIGGASADRLVEMAGREGFIVMTGKSYRGNKLKRE